MKVFNRYRRGVGYEVEQGHGEVRNPWLMEKAERLPAGWVLAGSWLGKVDALLLNSCIIISACDVLGRYFREHEVLRIPENKIGCVPGGQWAL